MCMYVCVKKERKEWRKVKGRDSDGHTERLTKQMVNQLLEGSLESEWKGELIKEAHLAY